MERQRESIRHMCRMWVQMYVMSSCANHGNFIIIVSTQAAIMLDVSILHNSDSCLCMERGGVGGSDRELGTSA